MTENGVYDLIIVGGGPAGLTAGIYAMRAALKSVLIERAGYVVTDEKCETDMPGIFAVGDLRKKYANQIVLAAADGCTAAPAAASHVETRKGGPICQEAGSNDEQDPK